MNRENIDVSTSWFEAMEQRLSAHGRVGGCAMLALGLLSSVAFVAAAVFPLFTEDVYGHRIRLLLFIPAVFGLVFAVLGLKLITKPPVQMVDTTGPRGLSPGELVTDVGLHQPPFSVCSHCMVIIEDSGALGVCPHCDKASGYIPVLGEEDKALVAAAVGPGEAVG